MFNSIQGVITEKLPQTLYLDNNGVEWDLMVPSLSLDRLGPVGSTARVYTWLCHREDMMKLYGFASVRERDVFLNLMKVDGIGPKQAIKILSTISGADLEKAVDSEDLAKLEAAPGIGKKTAQKMILALKGKLAFDDGSRKGQGLPQKTEHEDIVNALAGMGFDRKAAVDAVQKLAGGLKEASSDLSKADFEKELFRRSIVELS